MGLEHGQDCLGSVVVPVRFVRESCIFVLCTSLAPAVAGAESSASQLLESTGGCEAPLRVSEPFGSKKACALRVRNI